MVSGQPGGILAGSSRRSGEVGCSGVRMPTQPCCWDCEEEAGCFHPGSDESAGAALHLETPGTGLKGDQGGGGLLQAVA